MTELRTLNDLEKEYEDELEYGGEIEPLIYYKCSKCGHSGGEFNRETINYIHRQLRQEAIKWVKDTEKKVEELEGKGYGRQETEIMAKFFNLTEEDLK